MYSIIIAGAAYSWVAAVTPKGAPLNRIAISHLIKNVHLLLVQVALKIGQPRCQSCRDFTSLGEKKTTKMHISPGCSRVRIDRALGKKRSKMREIWVSIEWLTRATGVISGFTLFECSVELLIEMIKDRVPT